ncbi:MAG: hypothetical protein PHH04_01480 [Thomasclavelia sp.]|nr:hypothetical protein [Thomasclavelia sp.]
MYKIILFNSPIYFEIKDINNDLLITIYGGTKPHIGSVTISEPIFKNSIKTSTFSFENHKDYVIAKLFSERIAKEMNKRVVCCCGIHYDNLNKDQIREIEIECQEILERIIEDQKNESK